MLTCTATAELDTKAEAAPRSVGRHAGRRILGRSSRRSCRLTYDRAARKRSVFEFSLWLSRACLGQIIIVFTMLVFSFSCVQDLAGNLDDVLDDVLLDEARIVEAARAADDRHLVRGDGDGAAIGRRQYHVWHALTRVKLLTLSVVTIGISKEISPQKTFCGETSRGATLL